MNDIINMALPFLTPYIVLFLILTVLFLYFLSVWPSFDFQILLNFSYFFLFLLWTKLRYSTNLFRSWQKCHSALLTRVDFQQGKQLCSCSLDARMWSCICKCLWRRTVEIVCDSSEMRLTNSLMGARQARVRVPTETHYMCPSCRNNPLNGSRYT